MISKDIQQLLQECLDGFDGGLTPEECLSAYPRRRAELEPLFRQAISLRVAYAAAPQAEFRVRAREKLLFAAGRDVVQALASEPAPEFVSTARVRLLNRAGAGAQEALRDVPPPRLPFWVNARRHLLEVASAAPPKPAPRMPVGLRTALSAAVIVLAVAIAGAGFFMQNSPANRPTQAALSAELNFINEQVTAYEQARASGQSVSSTQLDDLAERTSKLAEQYSPENPNAEILAKLPDLIQRQQTLLADESTLDETLATAQERLDAADEKLAAAPTNTAEPASTGDATAATAASAEPTEEATAEPTPTPDLPDVAIVSPSDVGPNGLVWQYDESVTGLGLRWWRVTTSSMTFVMPESWKITNLETNENGLAVLAVPLILVQTDLGLTLAISTENGEVNIVNTDPPHTVRAEGSDGAVLDPASLAEITGADANWAAFHNMLVSIELVAGEAVDGATETPAPAETATPESSATPDEANP